MKYSELLNKYPEHKSTCSINLLKPNCFTFIRDKKYLSQSILYSFIRFNTVILVKKGMKNLPSGRKFEYVNDLDYTFTMLHNTLRKNKAPKKNVIGENCFIHKSAILDVEGIHVIKDKKGNQHQLKHMGNIVIEDDVMILALATIQRAVFDSTIIKRGVKIDSRVNIGHNCYIGENTAIALGAIIAGSVTIGKNCMIGLGAILRNGITLCDNVIIGMGSNVVKDIKEPGIYMGSPAKLFKPYNKNWNWTSPNKK